MNCLINQDWQKNCWRNGLETDKKIWKRNCPECNNTLGYANKYHRNSAEKKKLICVSCASIKAWKLKKTKNIKRRNCPKCNKEILYKHKYSCAHADKVGTLCCVCKSLLIPFMDTYTRNCPTCNKEIHYKSRVGFLGGKQKT